MRSRGDRDRRHRLSEPHIERAVYLCCLESIQNAAKHGDRGTSVTVQLHRTQGELQFSVRDTGCGFDPRKATRGKGLASLHDRVDTVGGHIEVTSERDAARPCRALSHGRRAPASDHLIRMTRRISMAGIVPRISPRRRGSDRDVSLDGVVRAAGPDRGVLFKTQHGIVDQSLHSRMGAEPTNGDGLGLGWYGAGKGPAVYHSVAPGGGDANLRELAAHVESPLFLAYVRAAIGPPVQQTNCHPFSYGLWLFVHNGYIGDFTSSGAPLALAIDPALFADITGSIDTEVVFRLAPSSDSRRTRSRRSNDRRPHRRRRPSAALLRWCRALRRLDGVSPWAVLYATEGRARSLFMSADASPCVSPPHNPGGSRPDRR